MRPDGVGVPFHILNPLRSFPNLFPAFSRSISLAFNLCCLTSIIICLPTGDISEEDAGEGVIPTEKPSYDHRRSLRNCGP